MVLCEGRAVSGRTSVCTLILDGVEVCVRARCEGFMHSAGVGVVLCPVRREGLLVSTATEPRLTLRKELCSETISIRVRNRCLEVAGVTETRTPPGTLQEPSLSTRRAGPRKYRSFDLARLCIGRGGKYRG